MLLFFVQVISPISRDLFLFFSIHKAGSWYLFEVLFKISDVYELRFYTGVPRTRRRYPLMGYHSPLKENKVHDETLEIHDCARRKLERRCPFHRICFHAHSVELESCESKLICWFVSIYYEHDRKKWRLEIISFVVLRHVNLFGLFDGHDLDLALPWIVLPDNNQSHCLKFSVRTGVQFWLSAGNS